MPDPDGSGHVQVFHFTSRISKKKISKYETASRRGMSKGDGAPTTTPPSDAYGPVTNFDGTDDRIMTNGDTHHESSPDADRPLPPKRLKLHVRKPADIPLTSSLAAENSDIEVPKKRASRQAASKAAAPAESSDLSSLASNSPPPSRPSSSRNKEYGDFMSYYIMDNDDDEEEIEPSRASPSATALKAQQPDPPVENAVAKPTLVQPDAVQPAPVKAKTKRKRKSSVTDQPVAQPIRKPSQPLVPKKAQPQPQVLHQPPPPPPLPVSQQPVAIPRIVLIDLDQEPSVQLPGKRDTVQEMIAKLQDLSRALAPFAGIPELSRLPEPVVQAVKKKAPPKKPALSDNPIDGFLDMFEDDSSDDEVEQPAPRPSLDYYLKKPGEPDHALAYGIQFIMNALRSWANQRLQTQFNQQYLEASQQQQVEYQQQQFRRGRPPKNGLGRAVPQPMPVPDVPSEIQMSLTNTPEGHAVRAFQEVLRSGSLQMNSALPEELTQALTHIYMQIDRLINQGARQDPPWQPHSYTAQIEAHRLRVAKFQEDQVRAQDAVMKQQHPMHDPHVLAHMHLGGQAHQNHQQAYAPEQQPFEIQRRRDSQYFQQQHQTEAMSPSGQPTPQLQAAHAPLSASPPVMQAPALPPLQPQQQSQQHGPPRSAGRANEAPVNSPMISGPAIDKRKASGPAPAMSNIKMYMPGWLPRSGTQMKFSFAPMGVSYGQPKGGSPHAQMPPPPQRTEAASPSTVSVGEEIVVAPSHRTARSETPTHLSSRVTQANSPATGAPTSISDSPALGSTSTTVSRIQSAPMDLASRFPHPGAVIVDR